MKHLRDKIEDSINDNDVSSNSDLYHTLFSDTLLGYTMKSDSAWALQHINDTLFQSNEVKDMSD